MVFLASSDDLGQLVASLGRNGHLVCSFDKFGLLVGSSDEVGSLNDFAVSCLGLDDSYQFVGCLDKFDELIGFYSETRLVDFF